MLVRDIVLNLNDNNNNKKTVENLLDKSEEKYVLKILTFSISQKNILNCIVTHEKKASEKLCLC